MTASEPTPQHHIVTGIDGSESSIEALQWAARQAQLTGATLDVITTWDWPTNWGWSGAAPEGYDPVADARAVLEARRRADTQGVPRGRRRDAGGRGPSGPGPGVGVPDADLLVVGSRGHGQFAGMLLGSVSEYCVRNAHCPVTVVRGPK